MFEEVAAQTSPTGAEDIFETGSAQFNYVHD
jgi:hypothetical protein